MVRAEVVKKEVELIYWKGESLDKLYNKVGAKQLQQLHNLQQNTIVT